MEISENLARLYQQLAVVCQSDPDGGEDLLAEAEDNALAACTAEPRNAYDSFLVAAALALQQPDRALPALQRSEHMQPNHWAPSLHLAKIYATMGRYDDALAACDRAMTKAEGADKLSAYSAREQVQRTKGDQEGARQTAEEARQFAQTLPSVVGRAAIARADSRV